MYASLTTAARAAHAQPLSCTDRLLTVWIIATMGASPALSLQIDRVQFVDVSLSARIGLFWMMYPVLESSTLIR